MENRLYPHLDQLTEALDRKDAEAVVQFLTEDCLFQAGNAPAIRGKEQIRQTLESFFPAVKSIHHQMQDIIETEGSAIYRGVVTYTRQNNSLLTVPVCDVFKMKKDKINEYYIYIDWSAL